MTWTQSGRAWGERAADWAYLVEPYARRVNDALFDRLLVGPETRLLDIACGSGYAANVAAGRGAKVSGLDASEALIAIARARAPAADFRIGDMFALPFDDDSFDVATSFNGIWKGCEEAWASGSSQSSAGSPAQCQAPDTGPATAGPRAHMPLGSTDQPFRSGPSPAGRIGLLVAVLPGSPGDAFGGGFGVPS